jgi:hypothetical protein
MVINMNETRLTTIGQIEEFLRANAAVDFLPSGDDAERYAHISRVLKRFDYPQRTRYERGILLRYLRLTSHYSRAQLNRLVQQWHSNRLAKVPLCKRYGAPPMPFARRYSATDVELLVLVDRAYEDMSGLAITHVLKRAHQQGDSRFERLAHLSVSHLYNLRKSTGYQNRRMRFVATRATCNPIGIRRAPKADGSAGYVRIDTVHQGDLDGIKGVYHITCVDEVSQWQVEACVQGISEAYLLPVLALILEQFPFRINGFHSDNGSEYINGRVAQLLQKLHIEQTKSRARNSNDNALAESKNASVVRKHMGYAHIEQRHAEIINRFYQTTFNPWLNMHRPCLFPSEKQNAKNKIIKCYKRADVKTPLECLALLLQNKLVTFKLGQSLERLQQEAAKQTDLAATQNMQKAKIKLFEMIHPSKKKKAA